MLDAPMDRAWSAKPGDVVLLRPRHPLSRDAIAMNRETLDLLSQRTGVTFVLLDSELDVVPPNGESEKRDPGPPEHTLHKGRMKWKRVLDE